MPIENASYIKDLNPDAPLGTESISEGDNHIRVIKNAVKRTFPKLDAEIPWSPADFQRVLDFVDNATDLSDGNGVFASVKHNGTAIMYGHNVSDVTAQSAKRYRVSFVQPTTGFDNHYSAQVTPIATNGRLVIAMITDQRAQWIEVDIWEFNGSTWTDPIGPVGFYMTMIDMIQTEELSNT